jgi:hypothetical protein
MATDSANMVRGPRVPAGVRAPLLCYLVHLKTLPARLRAWGRFTILAQCCVLFKQVVLFTQVIVMYRHACKPAGLADADQARVYQGASVSGSPKYSEMTLHAAGDIAGSRHDYYS